MDYQVHSLPFPVKPSLWFRGAMTIYRILSLWAIPLFWIIAQKRLKKKKEDPLCLKQRFGITDQPRPPGFVVWIHAASIGETRMALSLTYQLLKDNTDVHVLLTTQTLSARQIVPKIPGILHQMAPFDSIIYVKRFFHHWRPCCAFILESERWPNLLYEAFRCTIPLIGVNTKISEKSILRWGIAKRLFSEFLTLFSLCFTSSQKTKTQLLQASFKTIPVYVSPSLKYISFPDKDYTAVPIQTLKEFSTLWQKKDFSFKGRPYWLASCIHASEVPFILNTHKALLTHTPDLLLVLIPRHLEPSNIFPLTSAYWSKKNTILKETSLYIVDVFGQTQNFYQNARFCVLGGSFSPIGGHNIIEPVAQGCAVIHGPHLHNCPELYAPFIEKGASQLVTDISSLTTAIQEFLIHPHHAKACAEQAYRLYGATQKEIQQYLEYLSSIYKKIK
ncbi:3-deoxy-D-manno-octulosonic acid transferase [Holospora curviuscula]|uniref:3-deoxy-D-manno-octulosonic acid transferase n=1 Tax=Holospora curviuscula TaxID=1082868 RepID=A0A2S5R7N1_9PROT|nr:glycosyltransferase N-terminal domain-containing protein [Holospora curviuscula]PPE03297.1 3-deoxy-D-manno-octulosonic acid transferase [Holospora curviuscula]